MDHVMVLWFEMKLKGPKNQINGAKMISEMPTWIHTPHR